MSISQKIALVLVIAVLMSAILAYVCTYLLYGFAKVAVWYKARK